MQKGDIVDYLLEKGANVLYSEIEPKLRKTISPEAKFVGEDFIETTSDKISHIDFIIMNPPFSTDVDHVLHAFDIAPSECQIVSLCNWETSNKAYTRSRRLMNRKIEDYGNITYIGEVFRNAERTTGVEVGLINLFKPKSHEETNFDDYFDMTEEEVNNTEGIIKYNEIRSIVNRYVGALKLYKETLQSAVKMQELTEGFYIGDLVFTCKG